jgi:hypothetical protein
MPQRSSCWRWALLGREPINLERSTDVRFGAHNGLKSEIAPCPKSAYTVAKVSLLKVSKILRAAGAVFV